MIIELIMIDTKCYWYLPLDLSLILSIILEEICARHIGYYYKSLSIEESNTSKFQVDASISPAAKIFKKETFPMCRGTLEI